MKWKVFLSAVLFCLTVSSALAEEYYTVVKGDTLGKIAQRFDGVGWQDIYKANPKIENPNLIYPGQKLHIPTGKLPGEKVVSGKQVVQKKSSQPFDWKNPGANPVGKNADPATYIGQFRMPDEVKRQFVALAKSGTNYQWGFASRNTSNGEKTFTAFNAMGIGGGRIESPVNVAFDKLEAVKYWQVDFEGKRYYLICPIACYNWAFWTEDMSVEPKMIPEEIAEVPEMDEVYYPEPDKTTSQPEPLERKPSRLKLDPKVEAWLFTGINKELNDKGRGAYWGISASFFPASVQVGDGQLSVGPAWQNVGWKGVSGEVDYDGGNNIFGAEVQYLKSSSKYMLKALVGEKNGYVYGNGFPYYAHEWADLLAVEGSYQWWNSKSQWEVGFRAEIATGNSKNSYMDGNPISRKDDPANDQSSYTVRAKHTWNTSTNFKPTLELNGGIRKFDDKLMGQIRPGVKFYDEAVEVSAHYQWVESSGKANDSVGLNLNVNLSKVGENVYKWLKNSKSQSQKT